ncbi:hypothetical protein CBI74_06750 [Salmonella enterica]|nr:hypothetical protein [Salmonella enterica subsp. enterica serovar Senftenberg]PEH21391.1 hypothetical protein CBI74_06750 [Salmonella enterica]
MACRNKGFLKEMKLIEGAFPTGRDGGATPTRPIMMIMIDAILVFLSGGIVDSGQSSPKAVSFFFYTYSEELRRR